MKKVISIFLALMLLISCWQGAALAYDEADANYFLTDYDFDDVISSGDGTIFAYVEVNDDEKNIFVFDEDGNGTNLGKFNFDYWADSAIRAGNIILYDDILDSIELHKDGATYSGGDQMPSEPFAVVRQNGKWGATDRLGKIIVPCQYDNIYVYRDLLIVINGDKHGVCDATGKLILPVEYDYTGWFSYDDENQYYFLEQNGKKGRVNASGELVIPCEYDELYYWDGYYIAIKNGLYGILHENGTVVIDFAYDGPVKRNNYYEMGKENKYMLLSLDWQILLPCDNDYIYICNENLTIYRTDENNYGLMINDQKIGSSDYDSLVYCQEDDVIVAKKNGKYGLLSSDGTVLIDFIYIDGGEVSEGLWNVKESDSGKMGYVDIHGNVVIDFTYDVCESFYGGVAQVATDSTVCFIDQTEAIVSVSPSMEWLAHITGSLYQIRENEQLGVFNAQTGTAIVPCEYDEIYGQYGRVFVRKDTKYGIVRENGEFLLPCEYDSFVWAGDDPEYGTILLTSKDNKKGTVNLYTENIVEPGYDVISETDSGQLLCTELDGKYGFISLSGIELFACEFDEVFYLGDGFIRVRKDGKPGLISADGIEIIACEEYDNIYVYSSNPTSASPVPYIIVVDKGRDSGLVSLTGEVLLPCEYSFSYNMEGATLVTKDGKSGFIDRDGTFLTPMEYERTDSSFHDIHGLNTIKKDGKYGVYNKKGEIVLPCEYDDISSYDMFDGMAIVEKDDKYGMVDAYTLEIILPCEYTEIHYLGNALFLTIKGDEKGVFDKEGNFVFDTPYNTIGLYSDGLAFAHKTNEGYDYIDESGAVQLSFPSAMYAGAFRYGYAWIQKDNNEIMIIDLLGNDMSPNLDSIASVVIGQNGIVGISKEDADGVAWRLIDLKEAPKEDPEEPEYIPLEDFLLNRNTLAMNLYKTATLSMIAYAPMDSNSSLEAEWAVSDPAVLRLTGNGGQIKAVGEGVATVYCTIDGITKTCTVTVRKETVPIQSFSLKKETLNLAVYKTATLEPLNVLPLDTTELENIKWFTSNPEVVTFTGNGGQIKALKKGTAVITCQIGSVKVYCRVTVG